MFLLRYCTESAKDPLAEASFDGMGRSLRNDYLKQVQQKHYHSDLVRARRDEYDKENVRNGTAYPKDEASCLASISDISPSEDNYGSSLGSYDETTGHSRSDEEESTQRDHSSSSSNFSAPKDFLYSSMQTDDSRYSNRQNIEPSSRSRSGAANVEQTTPAISGQEKDRLLRAARRHMVRNPKSLLGSPKQSLDYSCSYISSEDESSYADYGICGPIQEEDRKEVTDEEDDSYNSRSQPDRNYTKHLYADGRQPATSRAVNPKLAIGMSTEETAKNLDEAFCMSMTEDGSVREESTLCEDLSDFGSNRSCLPSFGYGTMLGDDYSLVEEAPKQKTPKLQRHVNFPGTPSPNKSSKELISAYLRAREARKSGGSSKSWLSFLHKEAPCEDRIIVGEKTQEPATTTTSDILANDVPSNGSAKANVMPHYQQTSALTNPRPVDAANSKGVENQAKPGQHELKVDHSKNVCTKHQFSRPETPECSIDYANVIDEFLKVRGVVQPPQDLGEPESMRPVNLVQSERADVSALSNPSYLASSQLQSGGHLEFMARRTPYATIDEMVAYKCSSNDARANTLPTAGELGQYKNANTFELQSPSTLTSASMVHKRNDSSSYECRNERNFEDRIPADEESGSHVESWSERRSETDSYGFSIRNDDADGYTHRDAAQSRHVDTYYDARDDDDRPRCMKVCFPAVDRFVCSSTKHSGGYSTLIEDSPPPFLKGQVVTPRTVHSPFEESPAGAYYGMQLEI